MFRKAILGLAVAVVGLVAVEETQAQYRVRGHFRSSGSYVAPHYRSNPDGNFYNNWSTSGNVNPYTGSFGTRSQPSYLPYHNRSSWGWRW